MVTEIRNARPSEFATVGDLTVAAYRTLPVDHLWGGYEAEIRDVATRAAMADVLVAVDTDSGDILGAVTFVSDPESAWLEWTESGEVQFRLLAVSPRARGRGVGEALVRVCLDRAEKRPVMIHTTQWMTDAQRLYERLGFVRRADRDVPESVWRDPHATDVPPAFNGAAFWAYRSG